MRMRGARRIYEGVRANQNHAAFTVINRYRALLVDTNIRFALNYE